MQARHPTTRALCALTLLGALALAACTGGAGIGAPGSKGFRADYTVARAALEAGRYDRANRAYAALLPQAGPLAPRIRLEYAHSLLRGGDFTAAARQSRALADSQQGRARAAALSVHGTALHEIGLAAIQSGDSAGGAAHLRDARAALAEVLTQHPDLDPLGALAGRKASIEARLKLLG